MKIEEIICDGKEYVRLSSDFDTGYITIPWAEFWDICRYGTMKDVLSEVHEYMCQCPDIDGIDCFCVTIDVEKEIAKKVIDNRISDENGDQIYYAARGILSKLRENNNMKIRDLIALDIDIDIYNDVTDEVAPAFCGAMYITDDGIAEFADILDISGTLDKENQSFTVLVDRFPDWENRWNSVKNFFTCAAGYCDSEKWDKWFGDDENV